MSKSRKKKLLEWDYKLNEIRGKIIERLCELRTWRRSRKMGRGLNNRPGQWVQGCRQDPESGLRRQWVDELSWSWRIWKKASAGKRSEWQPQSVSQLMELLMAKEFGSNAILLGSVKHLYADHSVYHHIPFIFGQLFWIKRNWPEVMSECSWNSKNCIK